VASYRLTTHSLSTRFKALEGGTFMEAFSMLTGFPVQRIVLARHTPG